MSSSFSVDPGVLLVGVAWAQEIVDQLPGFEVEEAGTRRRPVETEDGYVLAIDCLVRARAVR